jgi:putative ABC transport system ATP-binding protein
MPPIIQLTNVHKSYALGILQQPVLHGINLEVVTGEFVAIVGPSGNGKSTLLNLLAGIDKPSSGQVQVCGSQLQQLSEAQLSIWRGQHIGIVFQFFQLLPALTLLQNVLLPMDFVGKYPRRERLSRAQYLLELVGLSAQAKQLPSQVSGGQQQRAAIARALANDPALMIADEPTGNLDSETADSVFSLFLALQQQAKTIVMVTHNEALAALASRQVAIHSGRIASDSRQGYSVG